MNAKERMRRVPPMVCTAVVSVGMMAMAFSAISTTAVENKAEPLNISTGEGREISIEDTETIPGTQSKSRDWGAEDAEILLQIAMAEAEGESTEGKALVMLVVLNRTWSDSFPDSVEDVVFQKAGGTYQFSPTAPEGRYWTAEPNEDCYRALDMVTRGWDESKGALYFEACDDEENWHSRNLEYIYSVGRHRFYK